MVDVKWWEEQPKLWAQLVPSSGQATTVQGELIRCTGKLADEAYRNGNLNWESGYERLARFVLRHLDDPKTFSETQRQRIRTAVDAIIRDFEVPDLSGHGSAHYFLTEMAVRWRLANPEPLPHEQDLTLPV